MANILHRTSRRFSSWRPAAYALLSIAFAIGCSSVPEVNSKGTVIDTGGTGGGTGGDTANNGGSLSFDPGIGDGGASVGMGAAGDTGVTGPVCGDSVVDPLEGCDDGNAKSGDGCDGNCKVEHGYSCKTPGSPCTSTLFCGDGVPGPDEACDDGNKKSGDGCSSSCAVESGFSCSTYGVACTPTTTPAECGNSLTEFGETCDDGNTTAADGCSGTCQTETGYTCNGTSCTLDAACGDGVLNTGEQCDDGNKVPGDCCNGSCALESNCKCSTPAGGSGAQVCASTIVCGDGAVTGDEACDDGNTTSGDGCSADCHSVEGGYNCPVTGGACSHSVVTCPNAQIDAGEECDDGNSIGGDGCAANCKVEAGYVCPTAGQVCKLKEFCGNGTVSYTTGETCDDGNNSAGDGCAANCKIEAGYTCNSASPSVCTKEVCGNKKIAAGETCDDGNNTPGDGCSATCRLEVGYTCPVLGSACRTVCGDKRTLGSEQCDDGNLTNGDGCNARCQLEPGYVCSSAGVCRKTVCGDHVKEGTEQCDDTVVGATDLPFDGCYNCLIEPDCSAGACQSTCGDGQRFSDEACDDGNTFNGDGCSSSCTVETGFTCTDSAAAALPGTQSLPIIVRDFVGLGREVNPSAANGNYHPDFNRHVGSGIFKMVKPTLTAGGKPDWRWLPYTTANVNGVTQGTTYTPLSTAICSCNEAAPLGSWVTTSETWTDGAATEGASKTITLVRPPCSCTDSTACTCDNSGHMFRDAGVNASNRRNLSTPANFAQWYTDVAGTNLTVPYTLSLVLTDIPTATYSNLAAASSTAFDPIAGAGWVAQGSETASGCGAGQTSNVSFSTETHFWFEYQGGERFDFSGDDDTWVFVNQKLVVDLGGLHGKQTGYFILDADTDGAGADIADGTATANGNGSYYDGTNYTAALGAKLNLGLVAGKIYELSMFQAERNQCGSNFGITLKNFGKPKSNCSSSCGDGIVAADEACDLGAGNTGGYGGCNANCTLAPYCGDGSINGAEQCDDGVNANVYGSLASGCAPGCKVAPYCGDGVVDVGYGEACDKGGSNSASAYGPGTCTDRCQPAAFCGDGVVNGTEACDDGQNNGGPTSLCDTTCAVKCGNGKLDPGEQCDLGTGKNTGAYGGCKSNCALAPYCGDGIKQANEGCDDGKNDGSYGTCTATCQLGAYCGDGKLDSAAGEQCDLGAQNQAAPYGQGLCATTCKLAPYCGDHAVNTAFNEKCDDGSLNSNTAVSVCKLDCSGYNPPPQSCGNGTLDAGEQCDHGSALNGAAGDACDGRCRFKCGNGIKDTGEQCDNGVNDGSYGTCKNDCTNADYCGDGVKNGTEQCDLGAGNSATAYGPSKCTAACKVAPYCGDHRVNGPETCDGQIGCTSACVMEAVH